MSDRGGDFARGTDPQGAVQRRLLIAQPRSRILTFGDDRPDDEACDGEGRHENLQSSKTCVGAKADLRTDHDPNLHGSECRHRARGPMGERNP